MTISGGLAFRAAEPPRADEVRGVVGLDGWPARFAGRIVRADPVGPNPRPGGRPAGPYDVGVAFTRLEAPPGAGLLEVAS